MDELLGALRSDPSNPSLLAEVEQTYRSGGNLRDLTRALEDLLKEANPDGDPTLDMLHEQLAELYAELGDLGLAAPHLERLLTRPHVSEPVLSLAELALDVRTIGARIAPLLADTYARLGRTGNEIATLKRELKLARAPRLNQVQLRLALLHRDVIDDGVGALELLEALVTRDASDDEARRALIETGHKLNQLEHAGRVLERAARFAKDPAVRWRVTSDFARLLTDSGDPKRAFREYSRIVAGAGPGAEPSVVTAAQAVLSMADEQGAPLKLRASALAALAEREPDPERRLAHAVELVRLCEEHAAIDRTLARAAYRTLAENGDTSALDKLEALAEASNDVLAKADVLEQRARLCADPELARQLDFASSELRASAAQEPAAALAIWQAHAERHGRTRELDARLLPLLEQAGDHAALTGLLEREAELTEDLAQRSVLFARAGQIALERLGDQARALGNFERSLQASDAEPTARRGLLALTRDGQHRLTAARLLDPLLGRDVPSPALFDVLEARFTLEPDPAERFAALQASVALAERSELAPRRRLELYGAGLPHVSHTEPERLSDWLDQMRALAEGDLALRYAELVHAAAAADPTSPELLEAVDQLAEAASESLELRLARWDAALAATDDERRVDALKHHRARLLAELGDTEAATALWQEIIERHPSYAPAHEGLLAVYHAAGDVSAVYSELERALLHLDGYDRVRALWHMAQILEERGELTEALVRYGELLKLATFEEAGLQKIERLADELGDPEIACRVLEYRIEHCEDPEQRVELLERLGELRLERLGDEQGAVQSWRAGARLSDAPSSRDRAQRLYERLVATVPSDREAAERLVSLYAEAGQWAKIPEALGVLLHAEDGNGVRVDLLLSLEQQALKAGAAVEYLDLVDEALWQLGGREPEHARELLGAKARLLSGLPDRFEAAAEVYRTLVDTYGNPEDVRAFEGAIARTPDGTLRRELSRWLFEWRSARTDAPADVLVPWAEFEERELGDARAAIGLYERALAHAPERKDLHTRLARLKLAEGDADGALEALRQRDSNGAGDPALELEFARQLGAKFGRHDAALELVAPYLEGSKPNPDAVNVALAALDDEDARTRAVDLLERAVETESPERAAQILRRLLEAAERAESLAERRLAWFTRLSQLLDDAPGQSLAVAALAVEHFPNDEQAWTRAVELSRQLSDPQILVDAGSRALERRLDPEVADVLGRRLLEFVEDWSVNPGALSQILRRVLDLAPRSRWAFDRLKLLLTSQTRYDELFELYDQAVEAAADDAARADVLDEAALVAKDVARDLDRSVRYLRALVELRPEDERVRVALERQYERQGNRAGLAELLVKHAARTEGSERVAISTRIAKLYLELEQAGSALEWIEPLIADHETDASVHELLEQVAAAPLADDATPRESAAYRAATQLKRLYEISSAPANVARQLERLLELVSDRMERAELLAELVNLRLDALNDPAAAMERLSELVLLEPRSSAHRVQLAELAARLGAQPARVSLLERAADAADAELALELFDEAARASREHLNDDERAAQLYRRALEKNAGDPDGVERVAPILEQLLERAGKSDEQCAVLEDLADKQRDAAARRDTLLKVARIALDRLGDGQRAARALAVILEHDGGDREALDANVRALEHAADWAALVGALRARAAHGSREDARRDQGMAARLLAEPLQRVAESIAAWREVQREFGSDPESFGALSELLTKQQDWPELSALLERELEAEKDPIRRRELFFRLGEVHRDHTEDRAAALEAFASSGEWQLAIELVESASVPDTERETLTAALFKRGIDAWKQGESPGSKKPAEAALWAAEQRSRQLSARGEPARAIQLLERSARLPFDLKARRELTRLAAELHATKLDNRDQAAALFRELLEADPNDETASRCFEPFAAVLEQQGQHEELARLRNQQAELCLRAGAADDARRHWEQAGELWREQDVEKALAAYARAGELGSLRSLATMTEIHRGRGEYARAARVLRKLYAAAEPDQRAGYALELADALGRSGEPEQARAALEEVAASGRDTPLVRERLAALYRAEGALRPLAGLLVTDAEHEASPARRAELLREAARLYDEIGEPGRAVPLLESAREAAPDSPQVHCEIARVLCKTGQSAAAIALLRARIETYGERRPRERALLHWELGRALVGQNQAAEGVDELRLASQIWPNHPGVMQELAERAFEHGNLELAESTYRTLLLLLRQTEPAAPAEAVGSSAVYLELAEIAQRTGDPRQAEDLVESAFEAALRDDAEQQALERGLAKRGQTALLRRALEGRLKRARTALASSAALADLLDLARASSDAALAEDVRRQADAAFEQLRAADVPERESLLALAGVYSKIGDDAARNSATEIYERLFQHDPDDGTIARTLAEAYGKSGQFAAWVELVDTSASRVTTSSEKSQLRTRAARAMLEYDSESSFATELLSQAALDDPDNDECATLLADLLERRGDIEGLVELLGRRADASSTPLERINTTLELAALLARSDRHDEAWAAYCRVLTVDPSHKQALQGLIGLVDKVNVEPANVAGILEALIELETGEARAELSERLIQTYYAQEEWTKLAAILRSSLSQRPDDSQRRRQLIEVLCKNDQADQALELIDAELEDNPADHELFRRRAALLEEMGDHDGALAALERAQDLDASHTDALIAMLEGVIEGQKVADVSSAGLRLATLFKKQGRLDDAQAELTRILERDPTERRALEQMGKLATTRQDWQTVLDTYRRLANLGESRVVTALAIANASERLGRPLDARTDLELALERAPGHPEIVERLKRLYRASGDEPKLAALLLSMSETAEGDARLTLRLEAAELLVKNPQTAIQGGALLEQICEEQPDNIHAAELLARTSLSDGHPEQARALLERVARAHKGTRSKPYARLLVELGNVCLAEDDLLGAYQALREATDIDRSNGPAQLLFGLVAVDVDDLARADAALRVVTLLKAGDAEGSVTAQQKSTAYFQLGSLARLHDDLAKARLMFKKALVEDPNNERARRLLAEVSAN